MDQMLRGMTVQQFAEWRAYAEIEPFDETRADMRAGSVVQALFNIHRKKGKPAVRLKDCVLSFEPPRKRSPEEARAEIRKTMEMLMVIHNSPSEKGH